MTTSCSTPEGDLAARRARTMELRRPAGQVSPESAGKLETPAEFVRRRMRELDQSAKAGASPPKKRNGKYFQPVGEKPARSSAARRRIDLLRRNRDRGRLIGCA